MVLEHAEIERADLVGRYRSGRLGADETVAFEEHLLACGTCLDALETDAELAHGLRVAAAEDALRASRPLAVLAWLSRLSRSRQVAALAATALMALFVPVAWQQQRLAQRTRELSDARAAAARQAPAVTDPAEPDHAASHAEQARLQRELTDAQRSREALAERLERALAPQANTPILRLSPLRSLGGAPADRLHLPQRAGWVVLSLELPPAEYPSYRVRLKRAGAAPAHILSQDGLKADAEGLLSLAVHASMLIPGDYEATVQGLDARGEPAAVGRFAFRVE